MSTPKNADTRRKPTQEQKSVNTSQTDYEDLQALPSDSMQVRAEKAIARMDRYMKQLKEQGTKLILK